MTASDLEDKPQLELPTDSKERFVVETAVQDSVGSDDVNVNPTYDLALKYLVEHEGKYAPLNEKEHKGAVRKTDRILLPILFFTATMGAVDKVCLGTTAIFGLIKDNNLHGQQYSWLGSILFIGSLVGMWPMTYLLQHFRMGKVMSCCSLIWSVLSLLHCACHNFAGLAALRFLMGFVECAIVPGCGLMIASFYLKNESPHRTALVFMFASSVINGALSALATTFGNEIPTWKYIFILVGSVSFVWSLFITWYLPDSPINAKWLSERQRYHMVKRVADNATGVQCNYFKWSQVWEAFADPRVYIVMLFNFGINIPNGGLSAFSSIIIKNLGFTSVQSSLMGIPTGVIASISTVFFTWLASRWTNKRCLVSVISLVIPLIGAIILYTVDRSHVGPQLLGLYLMYFYFASYIVMMSCVQANTAGSTKKSVTYGFNYLGYCGGAITGTQTFRSDQAPKYTGGFISILVAYCACMVLSIIYWFVSDQMNRKKKNYLEKNGIERVLPEEDERIDDIDEEKVKDLTDKQQIHFFYTT
ncbi:unnamed protein product [Ambrosiozyma monospora]|uniref:Unnamed protein product n=1 Tax=Ambrosiozyma monospora TaxID=43982 RepID=A0A9W7DDG2_AMBMO|nr:unnamed protein product [Ambrosiozyma monospora]